MAALVWRKVDAVAADDARLSKCGRFSLSLRRGLWEVRVRAIGLDVFALIARYGQLRHAKEAAERHIRDAALFGPRPVEVRE